MSSTVKALKQLSHRFLLRLFVGLYIAVSMLIVFTIYQSQNDFQGVVEAQSLTEAQLSSPNHMPFLLKINKAHFSLKESNFYRQLSIVNSRWYLSFQQPVIVLLTSPLYILFTLLLFVVFVVVKRNVLAIYTRELAVIDRLENWANLAVIQGKACAIKQQQSTNDSSQHIIIEAIHQIQQQLHDDFISDISSDQSIRASALLDQETHIGNRAFFDNRLQAFLKGEDVQGAVLLIQFKELELVQSLYGYQQAMSLLTTLIQVTKQRLHEQPSYFIARRSDYELSILLPGVFIQEVEKLTDRLLKNLQTVVTPIGISQEEFIHIGVSYFSDEQAPYQVMSEADMALRTAQLQGPSQWFMFEAGELEEVKAKGSLKWRTFLTAAINGNGFVIFFQPVIASDSARVVHNEVLSKVRDQNGTLISARVFLPMAKKCGLTVKIDLLILEQVCRVLAYEKREQEDCSINIAIDSLLSKDFSMSFLSILTRFPDVRGRLMIEISEYQLVNHLTELQSVINDIHSAGVKIVADKVGQYVISANYINVYPIAAMKLHRSIVLDIDKKTENQVFIQSLKSLAAPKNIPIYALGVEQQAEWRTLLQLGIQGGQGHYFTEPVAQVAKAIHLH
jgi:RNase E specificity factor CsrD